MQPSDLSLEALHHAAIDKGVCPKCRGDLKRHYPVNIRPDFVFIGCPDCGENWHDFDDDKGDIRVFTGMCEDCGGESFFCCPVQVQPQYQELPDTFLTGCKCGGGCDAIVTMNEDTEDVEY